MKELKKAIQKFWHDLTGHPKDKCVKTGGLSVRCECGKFISLSDYY